MGKPTTQQEIDLWNAGASTADSTWWQQAHESSFGPYGYQDELSPDGRSIYLDHKGYYKPKKDLI